MRYGTDEGLLDLAKGRIVEFRHLLAEILELVEEDAVELECINEVRRAKTILEEGTSAHQQVQIYGKALKRGDDQPAAMRQVVEFLIERTGRIKSQ